MNVLVFTTLFPNNVRSGHGLFVRERIRHFARGHADRVRVVAPVPYCPPLKFLRQWQYSQVVHRERTHDLEVYHPRYFLTPKVGMGMYGRLMYASVLRQVRRLQKEQDFDLIDAHYVYPDGYAAVKLGQKLGKPVVVSARGSDVNVYSEMPGIRRLLRYTLGNANQVVAVSTALKRIIKSLEVADDKITVIPNGVDCHAFRALRRDEARTALGIRERRVVLFVGHLDRVKGIDRLLEAFCHVSKQPVGKDAALYLVGEGLHRGLTDSLIDQFEIGDRVRLVGAKPQDELYRWYSAADVLCLPSRREGWPNVLLESLACGTPVVATRVGGMPEILTGDDLGTLVGEDPGDVARGLVDALQRSWDRRRLVAYAREHSWERAARSMARVFERATRGRVAGDSTEWASGPTG